MGNVPHAYTHAATLEQHYKYGGSNQMPSRRQHKIFILKGGGRNLCI